MNSQVAHVGPPLALLEMIGLDLGNECAAICCSLALVDDFLILRHLSLASPSLTGDLGVAAKIKLMPWAALPDLNDQPAPGHAISNISSLSGREIASSEPATSSSGPATGGSKIDKVGESS